MSELRDRRGLTESEAIAAYRGKNYPKPALTADICIFAPSGEGWRVLLIRRGGHPYLGCWALPGGFADEGETIEATAARELQEETGLTGLALKLVGVYSAPGRDPRGWTVSAAYGTRVEAELNATAEDDAAEAGGSMSYCRTTNRRLWGCPWGRGWPSTMPKSSPTPRTYYCRIHLSSQGGRIHGGYRKRVPGRRRSL